MAASRYRRFLKLCEEWPVDETKRGRDLGSYLRQRVAQAFREGENTQYPRPRDTSFSGLSVEEYKLILSTDTLEEFKDMNKGMWKKLQEKFAPGSPEEKHKAWAQSLSRPRT
ncbi:ubiquinol-cytochrome c reductase complex assembly factor 2 [Rhinolophus ferrumequinum]|uniref:Mitochondrial nucleoid factor 1 n=1 Tax=Rhinolophus ferrumequinum TaxID=59479 RepID=A0A671FSR6_RHIFE|nr:ubiquinol-cytochrome c reductase complex assembly factor 2 [Rhinolophus ferrumequinum]